MGWVLVVKFWPLVPPAINCLYRQRLSQVLAMPVQGAKVPTDAQVL